jgi:uncharacterized membrane protein
MFTFLPTGNFRAMPFLAALCFGIAAFVCFFVKSGISLYVVIGIISVGLVFLALGGAIAWTNGRLTLRQ